MLVTEITVAQLQHIAYAICFLSLVAGFVGHVVGVVFGELFVAVVRTWRARRAQRIRSEWVDAAYQRNEERRRANGW